MVKKLCKSSNDLKSKIKKAIAKLKTLDSIEVTKSLTSHYTYGIKKAGIHDRFDISIHLNDDQDVLCQIVLDSVDHTFPPDIIFKKSSIKLVRELKNCIDLLPNKGWDLNNENCLHDWFSQILAKKEQWFVGESVDKAQKEAIWDIFDEDFEGNTKKTQKKSNLSASGSSKIDTEDNKKNQGPLNEDSKPKSVKSFPIFNKGKRKLDLSEDESSDLEPKQHNKQAKLDEPKEKKSQKSKTSNKGMQEFRKKFILFWIHKYKDHVIQYDTTGFNNLAMYMTFEISDKSRPLWKEYHKIKAEHLVKFIEENNVKQKIPHPKSQAPMIVSFDLDNTNKLKIKLVSVTNFSDVKSSAPDSVDVDYELDSSKPMPELVRDINRYIHEVGIKFHLMQSL